MDPEVILETKTSDDAEIRQTNESVLMRTVRLIVNLLTNMLIVLTVFVCLLYACKDSELTVFRLHIILCVLGFQFLMCQATLVLSKHNSWSMFMTRRYRQHLHWVMQLIAVVLASTGCIMMSQQKYNNFSTWHGIFGLCALVASYVGLTNGLLTFFAHKISYINTRRTKFFHYVTGIATLLLSATSLCLGFHSYDFKVWSGKEEAFILIFSTCLFTLLVAIDFWMLARRRIRNLI